MDYGINFMGHTKGPVVQQQQYYPFGLAFNSLFLRN
jgi:hypothetical protein